VLIVPLNVDFKKLEPDMQQFIERYVHSSGGASILRVFEEAVEHNRIEDEKSWLFTRIRLGSIQKYFALYILIHSCDMGIRNVMLKVDAERLNKFDLVAIDNEKAFGKKPPKLPFFLGIPACTVPLKEKIRKIILGWNVEEMKKYIPRVDELFQEDYTYERVSALQYFLKVYPYANLRDIMMLAFFDTPTISRDNWGLVILKEIAVGGWGYYLKLIIDETTMPGFGTSFITYLNAITTFTVLKAYIQSTTSANRKLEDFIEFLINHELVKPVKEEIRNYMASIKYGPGYKAQTQQASQ